MLQIELTAERGDTAGRAGKTAVGAQRLKTARCAVVLYNHILQGQMAMVVPQPGAVAKVEVTVLYLQASDGHVAR